MLNPTYIRGRVTSFLALLSSSRAHDLLSREIPRERVAFELIRCWFDEIYSPSIRYVDGLRGDFSEAEARRFRSVFSAEELAAIERFHRFTELRLEMTPPAILENRRFPMDDRWNQIVKDASYLLDELEPNPSALRTRMEAWLKTGATLNSITGPSAHSFSADRR